MKPHPPLLSIRHTIGLAVLIMTGVMLLIFTFMGLKIRNALWEQNVQAMRGQWATLAESCVPALLFDDELAAAELLKPLKASPHLTAALLLHVDGRTLAHYGTSLPEPGAVPREQRMGRNLVIHQAIRFDDKTIGSLMLVADMKDFYALAQRLWMIFLLLLGFALSVALLASEFLHRRVSIPLARFAATTDEIARSGDYSQRVHARSGDELYTFAHGFNTMLETAQQRDHELLEHKTHLEEMVAVRTAALEHAKDAAEAANRAKSAFLANMSHELRTPLNAVLGYAQILQRNPELDETQQKSVAIIKRSGEYLLTLINDVLDLAKIEAGRLELAPAPCDLARFFSELSDIFRVRAADKGIAFHYLPGANLPAGVELDEKRLRQVCMNLLGNAMKFTVHGEVRLETDYRPSPPLEKGGGGGFANPALENPSCPPFSKGGALPHQEGKEPGQLIIRVSDTGPGIPAALHAEIFKPFQQAGEDQYKQEGTGLGLAISHNLIKQMQGRIEVESVPGAGSRFSVTIPAPVSNPASLPVPAAAPLNAGAVRRLDGKPEPLQVLVVDDNDDNRAVLRGLLEPLGFAITEAAGGNEALALTAGRAFDVIFMDLVMPDLDGLSATRRILARAGSANRLIIAVSARAFAENHAESQAAGCRDLLSKPVIRETLLRVLQSHLPLAWESPSVPESASVPTGSDTRRETLPAAWFKQLEQAVIDGNRKQSLELVTQVRDAELAAVLQGWVEGYEAGKLLTWIEKNAKTSVFI